MTDIVSPEKRSQMMAGIQGKDTKPELMLRKGLHKQGYRFRLHDKNLPGKPDIVLKKYKAVIFVNGCFWHKHECYLFKWPKSRPEFWREKLNKNQENDKLSVDVLLEMGWKVCVVWECALKGKKKKNMESVIEQIGRWLSEDKQYCEVSG